LLRHVAGGLLHLVSHLTSLLARLRRATRIAACGRRSRCRSCHRSCCGRVIILAVRGLRIAASQIGTPSDYVRSRGTAKQRERRSISTRIAQRTSRHYGPSRSPRQHGVWPLRYVDVKAQGGTYVQHISGGLGQLSANGFFGGGGSTPRASRLAPSARTRAGRKRSERRRCEIVVSTDPISPSEERVVVWITYGLARRKSTGVPVCHLFMRPCIIGSSGSVGWDVGYRSPRLSFRATLQGHARMA
jgi:hypothetical protein